MVVTLGRDSLVLHYWSWLVKRQQAGRDAPSQDPWWCLSYVGELRNDMCHKEERDVDECWA
jgi:hypothetical protein